MLRPSYLALAVALPAAVLLAACGSSSTSSSSTTATTSAPSPTTSTVAATTSTTAATSTANFDSCSVVTQPEAAAALGTSVTPGVLGNATVEGGLACVFYGPSTTSPTNPTWPSPTPCGWSW